MRADRAGMRSLWRYGRANGLWRRETDRVRFF